METKKISRSAPKKKAVPAKKVTTVLKAAMPLPSHSVCKTCNLLPVGSVEMTSLLLVLVFSLVSVLFTAVFALNSQQQKIDQLQELVSAS